MRLKMNHCDGFLVAWWYIFDLSFDTKAIANCLYSAFGADVVNTNPHKELNFLAPAANAKSEVFSSGFTPIDANI